MLPTALAYIVVVAAATLVMSIAGITYNTWQFALIMLGINVVLIGLLFGVIDRGRLISPAYSRLDKQNLARARAERYRRLALEPVTSEGGAD